MDFLDWLGLDFFGLNWVFWICLTYFFGLAWIFWIELVFFIGLVWILDWIFEIGSTWIFWIGIIP